MLTFLVEDMTCSHCEATLRRAILALDATAAVHVDLPRHLLQVETALLDDKALAEAVRDAGYTPVRV